MSDKQNANHQEQHGCNDLACGKPGCVSGVEGVGGEVLDNAKRIDASLDYEIQANYKNKLFHLRSFKTVHCGLTLELSGGEAVRLERNVRHLHPLPFVPSCFAYMKAKRGTKIYVECFSLPGM
jgi:hypothetical protein